MKNKKIKLFLFSSLVLTALACSAVSTGKTAFAATSATTSSTETPATEDPATPVEEPEKDYAPIPVDETTFPDPVLRGFMEAIAVTDKDGAGKTLTSHLQNQLGFLKLDNQQIVDLTGLDKLPILSNLDLSGTSITDASLAVLSKCQSLTTLDLANTSLTEISPATLTSNSITNLTLGVQTIYNPAVKKGVPLEPNQTLTTVNTAGLGLLKTLYIENTGALSNLSLVGGPTFEEVTVLQAPNVKSVNFFGAMYLKKIKFNTLGITDLNVGILQNIDSLQVVNCPIGDIALKPMGQPVGNYKGLAGMTNLRLSGCGLTSLDVSELNDLTGLDVSVNSLKELDIDNLTQLEFLGAYQNQLTELKIPSEKVGVMFISDNQLEELDLSHSPNLETIDAQNNKLKKVTFSDKNVLTTVNLSNNELTKLEVPVSGLPPAHMILNKNHLASVAVDIPEDYNYERNTIQYDAFEQTPSSALYQVNNRWYTDLNDIVPAENLPYVYLDDTDWRLNDNGIATYVGEGKPTSLQYTNCIYHLPGVEPGALLADARLAAVLSFGEDVTKEFNVNFTVSDEKEGSIAGEANVKVASDSLVAADAVPAVKAVDGKKFDHWEDNSGTVIDLSTWKPVQDTVLYAIFSDGKAEEPVVEVDETEVGTKDGR